jgi:hypothetical protein
MIKWHELEGLASSIGLSKEIDALIWSGNMKVRVNIPPLLSMLWLIMGELHLFLFLSGNW